MHYNDVVKLLETAFIKLGYQQGRDKSWFVQSPETTIVVKFFINTHEKEYTVDLGILFNKLCVTSSWKKIRLQRTHFGDELAFILYTMGEPDTYLKKLFSYDAAINSDTDIVDNISDLSELYQNKIIPYLEQFNDYAFLAENFEEELYRKQLNLYYPATMSHFKEFFELQFNLQLQQQLISH